MPSPNARVDPYRSFNFQIDILGVKAASFSECSGLTADGDHVEYREGKDPPLTVRKLTALRKYSNITLKRGYTTSDDLWQWYMTIVNGNPKRYDVSIILLDEAGKQVLKWTAENAWINRIDVSSFKASGNEVAMESVEIIHEGLTLEVLAKPTG
jgi:phage tail-like protein